MHVYHPNAVRETGDDVDGAVDVGGEVVSVGDDETLDVTRAQAERLAERYGLALSDIRVEESADAPSEAAESDEICGAEMSDGSICERPADECPYH